MRLFFLAFLVAGCSSLHVSPGCEVIKDTHERMVCSEEAKGKAADIRIEGGQ